MQKLIAAAHKYIAAGISVIAVDDNKRALFPWKKYQEEIISPDEITRQLNHPKAAGLAIICGKISGNLEVLDIDQKNDPNKELFEKIIDNISDNILDKLCIVKTRSGGFHIYFRCSEISGNQKFASRPPSADELKDTPHLSQVVLTESRGEAGYVIGVPTPGYTYYKQNRIPTITPAERDELLEICRSFDQMPHEIDVTKNIPAQEKGGYSIKPWEDYNEKADVIELLVKHGWTVVNRQGERTILKRPGKSDSTASGNYHHGLNVFKSFSTSTQFEAGRGYSPFGVYCMLEHGNDPSAAAKALIAMGYGMKAAPLGDKFSKIISKLKKKGQDNKGIVEELVAHHNLDDKAAKGLVGSFDAINGEIIETFWGVDDKGKVRINRQKLTDFLQEKGGYALYFYDPHSNTHKVVEEEYGFLSEASTQRMKAFIMNYILGLKSREPFDGGLTADKLLEVVMTGADAYFSKGMHEFMRPKEYDFLKDGYNIAYFPFRNGVVCVTPDKIERRSYRDINKVIWSRQVIDFDVAVIENMDTSLCEFSTFVDLVSGKQVEKIEYCRSLIGYLLHRYKDSARPWAVALAEETDDEKKGGGTGKGIMVKAISMLANTQKIDGKNFKIDKSFAFQRVSLDTRICAIEDVKQGVDFKAFYSIITEGITVEKKNQDELFIPYNDSPKIIFTTNYTIKAEGDHGKRRLKVFEFSNYFSTKHTPIDEFGHKLFEDWDDDELNRFYNFMFSCVQGYLKKGVSDPPVSETFKRKHIRVNFTEEFLDYFEQIINNGAAEWHVFGTEYKHFLSQNGWERQEYSSKRFKKALVDASESMGYTYEGRRVKQDANAVHFRILGAGSVPPPEGEQEEFLL